MCFEPYRYCWNPVSLLIAVTQVCTQHSSWTIHVPCALIIVLGWASGEQAPSQPYFENKGIWEQNHISGDSFSFLCQRLRRFPFWNARERRVPLIFIVISSFSSALTWVGWIFPSWLNSDQNGSISDASQNLPCLYSTQNLENINFLFVCSSQVSKEIQFIAPHVLEF